jgi:hypothetical protein
MASLHGDSSAGKPDLCCSHSLDAVGRPGLHQFGFTSFCFAGCFSPGPRKNDLTIYWALGPFVRSFTLLVDPGDIYLPQRRKSRPLFATLESRCHRPSSSSSLIVACSSRVRLTSEAVSSVASPSYVAPYRVRPRSDLLPVVLVVAMSW